MQFAVRGILDPTAAHPFDLNALRLHHCRAILRKQVDVGVGYYVWRLIRHERRNTPTRDKDLLPTIALFQMSYWFVPSLSWHAAQHFLCESSASKVRFSPFSVSTYLDDTPVDQHTHVNARHADAAA